MTRAGILALGAVAALLMLILGAEWLAGEARLARIGAPIRAAQTPQLRPVAAGDIGANEDAVDNWVRTALARPLMTSARRPAATPQDTGVSLTGGLPRLSGTIVKADGGVAIFARDDGGHPLMVREGATVGPYHILRINAGSVTLDGPTGVQTLHPRFGEPKPASFPAGGVQPGPMTMPGMVQPMPGFPQQMPGVPQQMPGLPQQQIDRDPG